MYAIKHTPEEFRVTELASRKPGAEGKYGIYLMEKRNYSTMQVIQRLSSSLKKPWKDLGFAGSKDRRAITTQYISIYNPPPNLETFEWTDITLKPFGRSNNKVALGALDGNAFRIVVRNLEEEQIAKITEYAKDPHPLPDYFGPQRFSTKNPAIGKALVTKDFRAAAQHIADDEGEYGSRVRRYRKEHPGDHIGGIRQLPTELINLYIGAYQSLIYNRTVARYLEGKPKSFYTEENNIPIPIIGFGTEFHEMENKEIRNILRGILREEGITPRDFILRQLPEATQDGRIRPLFFTPTDFKMETPEDDEVYKEKKKVTLEFSLKKSCYATTLLSCVLEDAKDILDHLG